MDEFKTPEKKNDLKQFIKNNYADLIGSGISGALSLFSACKHIKVKSFPKDIIQRYPVSILLFFRLYDKLSEPIWVTL